MKKQVSHSHLFTTYCIIIHQMVDIMKNKKSFILSLLLLSILAGCTGNPTATKPEPGNALATDPPMKIPTNIGNIQNNSGKLITAYIKANPGNIPYKFLTPTYSSQPSGVAVIGTDIYVSVDDKLYKNGSKVLTTINNDTIDAICTNIENPTILYLMVGDNSLYSWGLNPSDTSLVSIATNTNTVSSKAMVYSNNVIWVVNSSQHVYACDVTPSNPVFVCKGVSNDGSLQITRTPDTVFGSNGETIFTLTLNNDEIDTSEVYTLPNWNPISGMGCINAISTTDDGANYYMYFQTVNASEKSDSTRLYLLSFYYNSDGSPVFNSPHHFLDTLPEALNPATNASLFPNFMNLYSVGKNGVGEWAIYSINGSIDVNVVCGIDGSGASSKNNVVLPTDSLYICQLDTQLVIRLNDTAGTMSSRQKLFYEPCEEESCKYNKRFFLNSTDDTLKIVNNLSSGSTINCLTLEVEDGGDGSLVIGTVILDPVILPK